jgi:DNA-binding transcriptional LysR family regulator
MHLKGLDLNLLVVLDALLTEKSTTRAGQRVYLSQSATSGALARLRDFFGDQILVPCGQKMVLTPFAQTLTQPVRDILANADALISKTRNFDPATSTRLFVLNMSENTATLFIANTLPRIRELAPNVHIEIVTYHENIPEIIEQGDVDFIEVPEFWASQLHPSEVIFEETLVCIAWSQNKALKKGLSLDQFQSLGHVTTRVLLNREHLGQMQLRKSAIKPRFELILPIFGLVPYAVVNTDLIAIVNSRLASYYSRYLPLKTFPCPVDIDPFSMLLQWNRNRDNDEAIQWMRRVLISTLRPETG